MKKNTLFLIIFTLLTSFPPLVWAETEVYQAEAKHAIAIEASTGKVLYEKEAQTPASIASLTNLLTAYLVYEAIAEGKLTLHTPVAISDYPYQLTGNFDISNVNMDRRSYTVEDLLTASLNSSANSATIALAEAVAGSEAAFVDLMREKVASWGITSATLVNSSGLNNAILGDNRYPNSGAEEENQMSATDISIIARKLLLDYPQVLEITSQASYHFGGYTYTNTNDMLDGRSFERDSVDGLKTALTETAGSCFVATAVENDMRVITVILHADESETTPENRFVASNNLLNYAYQYFSPVTLVRKGKTYEKSQFAIFNGETDKGTAVASQDLIAIVRNRAESLPEARYTPIQEILEAPVPADTPVGTLALHDTDLIGQGYVGEQPQIPMVAAKNIQEANWPLSWWNHFVRYVNENL